MSQEQKRSFSGDFKRAAVKRMEAGEKVAALSKEFSVKRSKLYSWRDALRRKGGNAFPGKAGRPRKASLPGNEPGAEGATELARAQRRIAELERKIGQQQLDLDFFKQALRHIEAAPRQNSAGGATASSPTSRR
jgi:transposase-like protein